MAGRKLRLRDVLGNQGMSEREAQRDKDLRDARKAEADARKAKRGGR